MYPSQQRPSHRQPPQQQGRDNLTIEASFWYAPPPLPSNLFVHCPGVPFPCRTIIVSTAGDLLLFRVPVALEPPPKFLDFEYDDYDYVIYRAGRSPSLTPLPNPKPFFRSGILLYDLFPEDQERPPMLRHMRLPLPKDLGKSVTELGSPMSSRGIASVVKDGKPCLKLAGPQIVEQRLPDDDIETNMPCYRVDNWAITTWSNTMVHSDYSDDNWREDFTVWAPDIIISDTVRSKLLASGLLHRKPSEDGEETVVLALQNLVVSEPTQSLIGEEEVVYLMARPKYFHPKGWALAIDIKNHTLLDVAEFGTAKAGMFPDVTYRSSAISKYI
ncbi:hypothetical protein HU200_061391 [Digitaria exilis]|uniref:DUF1618 domain-containing protein n=1 Tax=Digitaria exilis TaxID=1010633 RepID=A0A835AHG2_9POAL|nr:hypothetical protein HU200_061391 [Digitaria exilis]